MKWEFSFNKEIPGFLSLRFIILSKQGENLLLYKLPNRSNYYF